MTQEAIAMILNKAQSTRRQSLKALGSLGLLGLSGCCGLRPFPESRISGPPQPADAMTLFLRPATASYTTKPSKYCLDVHAHFFNASDVNVKGYIEGPVAHAIRSERLRDFVIAMAPMVDEIAGLAPSADTEYEWLINTALRPTLSSSEFDSSLEQLIEAHRDKIAEELFVRMKYQGLDKQYIEIQKSLQPAMPNAAVEGESGEFTYETIRTALDPARRRSSHSHAPEYQISSQKSQHPGGIIEFVGHMLSYRWMNLRTYQQYYTEEEGSFGVDAVFGSMVDFDYWLDCPCRSAHEDQAKVHSLLSALSGGYMLPLIAYNPWTDIERSEQSFELVKRAITEWGFIGVKIYPPVGYFPYGNVLLKDDVRTEKPRPNLAALDERLEALFSWCAAKGVPVMAHTGESMGRDDESDQFGGPKGWHALLARFKLKQPPLINAGHFGGDLPKPPATRELRSNWPEEFARLMARPEGIGFFGDVGYWTALRSCESDDNDCQNARGRLRTAIAAFPEATKRIMYGTDWFMLSKETNWPAYAEQISRNLQGILPAENFLYQNAISLFGLGHHGQNRQRLEGRFEHIPTGLPKWLSEA